MKLNATNMTLPHYDVDARAFTSLHETGTAILDLGCKSGRDTRAFLDTVFIVSATGGSAEFCHAASCLCGIPVHHELFRVLAETCADDGV